MTREPPWIDLLPEYEPRSRIYPVGLAGRACKRASRLAPIVWKDTRSRCTGLLARLAAYFTAFLLFAPSVDAQSVCGQRDEIVNRLAAQYQETQRVVALATNGSLVEAFASPAGTWTIMYTRPGGRSCLIATGQNWQQIKEQPRGDGPVL